MNPMKAAIIVGVILVLIAAFAPAYYFYSKYQSAQDLLSKNVAGTQEDVKSLVERVGKLMDLPQDETPTVATVSDVDKLKDQPFFAKAKNGDKVLIYTKAKKAILFDPVAGKILEVGPLVSPTTTPAGAPPVASISAAKTPTGTT